MFNPHFFFFFPHCWMLKLTASKAAPPGCSIFLREVQNLWLLLTSAWVSGVSHSPELKGNLAKDLMFVMRYTTDLGGETVVPTVSYWLTALVLLKWGLLWCKVTAILCALPSSPHPLLFFFFFS